MLEQLLACLKHQRFDLHNEKVLQLQIAVVLDLAKLKFQRECKLSQESIIDFLVADIGVEVKIKGTPKSIYAQCLRYCEFEEVGQLVLLTNRQIHLPSTLNGKPTHILNLGRAWL